MSLNNASSLKEDCFYGKIKGMPDETLTNQAPPEPPKTPPTAIAVTAKRRSLLDLDAVLGLHEKADHVREKEKLSPEERQLLQH